MKETLLAILLLLGAASPAAEVAVSDLERMSEQELTSHITELKQEVIALSKFMIDPPPEWGDAERRDQKIQQVLTLEAEKLFLIRYRARHLGERPRTPPRYGVDQSVSVDISDLSQQADGTNLVLTVPASRWSGTDCRVLTDSASVGDITVLVFRFEYTGEPRGILKPTPVIWRLAGLAGKTNSFIVRRFPDTRSGNKEASNKPAAR